MKKGKFNANVISALGLLAVFFLLAAAYGLKNGPGNAPDERAHTENIVHMARTGRMPAYHWPRAPHSYEAYQPPLYYWLGARVHKLLGGARPRVRFAALRLLSILLHLAALVFLWRMAVRLDGRKAALAPLGVMALHPMFIFIGASVSNDSAANLAGAALLYFAVRLEGRPAKKADGWILGAVTGLGLLSKITIGPAAAAAAFSLWRSGRPKQLVQAAATALFISGFHFRRVLMLTGDPSGMGVLQSQYDPNRYAFSEIGRWGGLFFQSFWGRFGLMTQPMPLWAYLLAGALTLAAAAGWIHSWKKLSIRPGRRLLLLAFGLAAAQAFVYGFFLAYQPQARFCFPALAAWAVLFCDGLSVWTRRMDGKWIWAAALIAASLLQWGAWRAV